MNAFLKHTVSSIYCHAFSASARSLTLGLIASIAMLSVSLPAPAGAASDESERLTEITWAHPAPERVSRFIVMISETPEATPDMRWVEVGKPAGGSTGAMQFYTALIPVTSDAFIAIGAVGANGLMSSMSAFRGVPPPRPGQPLVVEP